MKKDPTTQARQLAQRLAEQGHEDRAKTIEAALAHETGHAALLGLRDFCQTLLTWIEAFDPVTMGMAEELRLAVDRELGMESEKTPQQDTGTV